VFANNCHPLSPFFKLKKSREVFFLHGFKTKKPQAFGLPAAFILVGFVISTEADPC